MQTRPVKEQPSGKMSPETFGPGVHTFPRNWKVKKKWVDDFKGNGKVPLAFCKADYKNYFLDHVL